MSVYNEKTKRRVIPRWRSSAAAAKSKDFQPLKTTPHTQHTESEQILAAQLEDFNAEPDLGRAAELLGTAARLAKPNLVDKAARFILEQGSAAPSALRLSALSALDGAATTLTYDSIADDAKAIAHIRRLLRVRPQTASLWVDMARHHAALGEGDKAKRSMRIALALAPDHRWVLRSATRLLLHTEEPEAAHQLLAKHPRTRHDPWLIAAEIASAQVAGQQPKFMRQARDMLRPRELLPHHISELAAAVATIELESGARKKARRLLRLALKDPTENALAQAEWAERDSKDGLGIESLVNRTPDAYEAACWVKYNDGQLEEALQAARQWLIDEPYATRPVGMVCYLAGFLDDYETLVSVARLALERRPDEVLHHNNLIYGELSQGSILSPQAERRLVSHLDFLRRTIATGGDDAVQATANAGLLCFRLGRADEGRQLYQSAMTMAEKLSNHVLRAHAAVMFARESILANAAWGEDSLSLTRRLVKRVASPGLSFYLRKLDALALRPWAAAEILSPAAAAVYAKPRSFVDPLKDLKIEQGPSGPILWVPRHLLKQ